MNNSKNVSVKTNYIYNLLLNLFNLAYPLLTYPYISRVLGSDGIGKVDFANSIVQYFIYFGALGLPVYGVREIAKAKNSDKDRNKVFSELFTISFVANILSTIVLLFLIYYVNAFHKESKLFYITSINMFFNIFAIDWLFQGLENYKYITRRSIFVKLLSIIFLFTFVKGKNDYIIYAFVSIIGLSGSNIINAVSARKYVKLQFKNLNLKKHIKPLLYIFSSQIMSNIYLYLNTTMLGFMSNSSSVGFYTSANKINRVMISLVTSLGIVLTPRISNYFQENKIHQIKILLKQSIEFLFFISIPLIFAFLILSKNIILLFLGKNFVRSIVTLQILGPVILFVGLSNITNTQILIPIGKEKYITKSVFMAAILNFFTNLILVPILKENGAAISMLVAEFTVTVIQLYYSRNIIKGLIFNKENFKYVFASLIMSISLIITNILIKQMLICLFVSVLLGGLTYIITLFILKDPILNIIIDYIKHSILKISDKKTC